MPWFHGPPSVPAKHLKLEEHALPRYVGDVAGWAKPDGKDIVGVLQKFPPLTKGERPVFRKGSQC